MRRRKTEMGIDRKTISPRRATPRLFGAGTIIALLAAGAYMTWTAQRARDVSRVPNKQNTADFGSKYVPPGGPRIDEIISARDSLALSGDQVKKLEELQREWLIQSKPAIDQMRTRATEMQEFMNNPSGKKITVKDMQDMAAPLSEATAKYRMISEEYQGRASEILSAKQRKLLAASDERKKPK